MCHMQLKTSCIRKLQNGKFLVVLESHWMIFIKQSQKDKIQWSSQINLKSNKTFDCNVGGQQLCTNNTYVISDWRFVV